LVLKTFRAAFLMQILAIVPTILVYVIVEVVESGSVPGGKLGGRHVVVKGK
jgi:hypothetical protein